MCCQKHGLHPKFHALKGKQIQRTCGSTINTANHSHLIEIPCLGWAVAVSCDGMEEMDPHPLAKTTPYQNNSRCCSRIFSNFTVVLARGGGVLPHQNPNQDLRIQNDHCGVQQSTLVEFDPIGSALLCISSFLSHLRVLSDCRTVPPFAREATLQQFCKWPASHHDGTVAGAPVTKSAHVEQHWGQDMAVKHTGGVYTGEIWGLGIS